MSESINRETMQALIDAPLANALTINLPMGRKSGTRAAKPVYEGEFATERLSSKQLRERKENAFSAKIVSLLDYYAGTSVPFDRIADHTRLDVEKVAEAMSRRGRAS